MALKDHQDILFVALSRPMMYLGVPLEGCALNGILWWCAYMFWAKADILSLRGVEAIFIGPAIHMLMSIGIAYDPNIFRLVFLWIDTRHLQPRRVSVLWAARWWKARNADELVWGGL